MAARLCGLRDGLVLAKNLNIRKLLIEIDAQVVVDIISTHCDHSHFYNTLIVDCKSLLQYFKEAHISHIHREGNHCADILAKEGLHNPNYLVLHSSPPSYILY